MSDWSRLPEIERRWLGTVPYLEALEAQREKRRALLAGESVPEALWAMEHPPVVTTGLRRVQDLPDASFFAARGVELHRVERGGLATYHGPGQLVVYVMLRLTPRGLGVRRTIEAIEQGTIDWLATLGIEADRRAGLPGVWVGRDKIAAVGLHVRRGVSLHGVALNLDVDLEPTTWFVPCGVQDGGVTTVRDLLGAAPSPRESAFKFMDQLLWALLHSSVDTPARSR